MLIICPECNSEISSFAESCPKCGLPKAYFGVNFDNTSNIIENINTKQQSEKKAKRKSRHKLPNGYGFIKKLSGNRANPYAVYPPTSEYTSKGNAKYGEAIDYCRSYNEAYKTLVKWHEDGRKKKERIYTFEEVYNMWFEDFKETHSSSSTINVYRVSFNKCNPIKNIPINELYAKELQELLDNNPKGYSSNVQLKSLLSLVFKYAVRNGMTDKNYAQFTINKKKNDNEKGIPFSEEELKIMWENRDIMEIAILLILVYTGMRVNELRVTEIHLKERYMKGGLKTKQGRERIIPIKEEIVELIPNIELFRKTSVTHYNIYVKRALEKIGIYYAKTNKQTKTEKPYHTSHDARHTFSWLADKYGMEEVSKYEIIGHSLGNDVDKKTYTHRTLEQLQEEIKKIPIIK